MTATRRCGTLRRGWPISTQARGHAPARHAAWIAVPWFPTCASAQQPAYAGGTPERRAALITADSHTKHALLQSTEAPTVLRAHRILQSTAHSTQHKHTHSAHILALCPSLTLLANALTRLLSGRRYACQLPGSPIHNQRARTRLRPSESLQHAP
jgi:hypothetical protein